MSEAGERLLKAAGEMRAMTEIPKEVMAAAMRALMVPEHEMVDSVSQAILAERERCAAQLRVADDHAEKIEALLDPHISWEGETPAAILAAEQRGEQRERERCAKIAASYFDARHSSHARTAGATIAAAIRSRGEG